MPANPQEGRPATAHELADELRTIAEDGYDGNASGLVNVEGTALHELADRIATLSGKSEVEPCVCLPPGGGCIWDRPECPREQECESRYLAALSNKGSAEVESELAKAMGNHKRNAETAGSEYLRGWHEGRADLCEVMLNRIKDAR